MDEYNCDKCKVVLMIKDMNTYPHRCEICKKILCRKCDDNGCELNWKDSGDYDFPDKYLCQECFSTSK
jgi:hypothetical protein